MKKEFTQEQLTDIAKDIIASVSTKKLCFHGEMGAGKTTLIKALVKELGCSGEVSSPTFGIVNEYEKDNGELLGYHFDFYRLNNENEALDFGIEDYLHSDNWLFMEWPEKINNLIPENTTNVFLKIIDQNIREISIL
ncbi:tRNA (adenosine(37)-N6)-threonylcarbamoyltransferase complex ATPase subunit type 1 TsaE [Cellulophaga baltica]|uniref:tRNA (adenosine(37)-N6)-threonylcarbamoyltransferase complex ATPase subunit type 1 TsaE n=1 Tax=Cellulophaga TaxID=104264 RepID=UPI001C067709|nr:MULTISPECIES: tRNA (adenosine(37)-N6)-threonylcarbamoyltransferase complex ATPase subunit type 1 TsaE [Cellulophaga]MBU2996192.1 tRNA (adenosine(37)-N6)-threonylcarbamoyltransferase complex ATPase subunit type 1 TsaE [Cellulophaga baltica]MDO6767587.1 tRNA (adenosine(37)-N6)-threonylcarbamoyltransferase complex ATPase subunit type 1 TsaE [Cellulophaga sp. 1_MG-2023]